MSDITTLHVQREAKPRDEMTISSIKRFLNLEKQARDENSRKN